MKQLLRNLVFHLKTFHSNRCYIIFQILQLALALVIIIRALTSANHFKTSDVMAMQYFLLLLMYVDMGIRIVGLGLRTVVKGKGNIVDLIIIFIFTITIISLTVIQRQQSAQTQLSKDSSQKTHSIDQNTHSGKNEEYQTILQTDDIIIIAIVMVRYIIQIIRTIFTIRNTHKNIEIDNKIKAIDLNKDQSVGHNNNSIIMDQSIRADQAVKQKMMLLKNKKSNKEHKNISARVLPGQQLISQRQNDRNMEIKLPEICIDDSI